MLPRDNERDTDFEDALTRRSYRPVRSIAIERQTATEKESQVLVDNTIQIEQKKFEPVIPIQEHPGESIKPPPPLERIINPNGAWARHQQELEKIIVSEPQKLYQAVKVPPTLSTIPARLKKRMGVAEIRAGTKGEAVKSSIKIQPAKEFESAFGLPLAERSIKDTPVKSLNLLDQFFNWLNAFLS